MRTGCIYALIDPRTNLVRYVGQTVVQPTVRYAQHIYQWKRSRTRVNSWIKSLRVLGLKPSMEIIEDSILQSDIYKKECEYIMLYKSVGAKLCNHTMGGEGTVGYKPTRETLAKISNSLRNSTAAKEKHIRHSQIMKERHRQGLVKAGLQYLTKEKRKELGERHSKRMKKLEREGKISFEKFRKSACKRVGLLDIENNIIKEFESASEAARQLSIKDPTHISKVCRGKQEMTRGMRFKYL